jgi:hypothetical protein
MAPEEYIASLIRKLPGIVKDAMDPQILQAELAVDISDNMGELNRNPVYPRADGSKKLQVVSGNLLRAASVYKASGNVTTVESSGTSFTFQWGIDLKKVPYARIHELGGEAGRKSNRVTIDARPYIGPALDAFSGGNKTINAASFTGSTSGFARIVNEIYLRLSLV